MSGTDIFLSYARTDRAAARMFAEAFADEGFSVWWDASLHSGETFDEVIEQKLRDAGAVVVLWSPRSVASRWVRAEATQADRRNKLAPAIIEPCDRPIIFELTHAADLCEWTGDITDIRWRAFVDDLRHLLERRAAEGHAPAKPAAKPQPVPPSRVDVPSLTPASDRRPLRPGSDEVIVAARRPHEPHGVVPHHPSEGEESAELHCLQLDDRELGQELFVVESPNVKVGRTTPADIVLPHRSVSREHCVIALANDELLVTDLNSTNGTYVDEERVLRAAILPVGSVLRIGQVTMTHVVRNRAETEWHPNPGTAGPGRNLRAGRLAAAR